MLSKCTPMDQRINEVNGEVNLSSEPTQLRILKLLWHDHNDSQTKQGFTSKQLAGMLKLTPAAINDAARALGRLPVAMIKSEPHTNVAGGGRPARYHVLNARQLITWPSTAFLVLNLLSRPQSTAERSSLVGRALQETIIDTTTQQPFTAARLERQLEYATDHQYVTQVDRHSDLLTVTPRVTLELEFLQYVNQRRLTAGACSE